MEEKKVILSSVTSEDDLKTLFKWINDKELVNHNSSYKPVDYISHLDWFSSIRNSSDIAFFTIRTTDGLLIGSCQLHSIDKISRNAELQIRIGETGYQSKGLGTQAVMALLSFGFNDLNLEKVYLHVFESNVRAVKAYEKCGFVKEGMLRKQVFIDGKYEDVVFMGILKEEFKPE